MPNRIVHFFVFVIFANLAASCHFFEDAENIDECPINSGYPCPCVPVDLANDPEAKGFCDDGSNCIYNLADEEKGFCSLPCQGATDLSSCRRTDGFGSEGICSLVVGEVSVPNQCVVVCSEDDECPPGLTCQIRWGIAYAVCGPELK